MPSSRLRVDHIEIEIVANPNRPPESMLFHPIHGVEERAHSTLKWWDSTSRNRVIDSMGAAIADLVESGIHIVAIDDAKDPIVLDTGEAFYHGWVVYQTKELELS